MKARFLFPYKLRYLGYLLAIPGLILGYLSFNEGYEFPWLTLHLSKKWFVFSEMENFTNELALTFIIAGLLLIAFSRQKHEDELTGKIRLNALYWAILINYGAFPILCLLVILSGFIPVDSFTKGLRSFAFLLTLTIYNLFIPLIIFIVRFYYLLYRRRNEFTVKPVRYLPNKPFRAIGKWSSFFFLTVMIAGKFFKDLESASQTLLLISPYSLLLWAYSKEKIEDEFIGMIRLEAMQVAVYANYVILLLANFLIYGFDFLDVTGINMFATPLIFIIWFQYRLFRLNRQTSFKSVLL